MNRYGRLSELRLTAEAAGGGTAIRDVYFTAPLKLMDFGVDDDGVAQAMILSASAGLLQGDEQALAFRVRRRARLRLRSQSFENIYAMQQGAAARRCSIEVEAGGMLVYSPLPMIPHKGSAFAGDLRVELEDESARFACLDVLTCGRYAHGERFTFGSYTGRTQVRRAGRLIYRDHTRLVPGRQPLDGIGFYEGFHCCGSLLLCGFPATAHEVAAALPPSTPRLQAGVTELHAGDLLVRLLSASAQELLSATDTLLSRLQTSAALPSSPVRILTTDSTS